MTEMRVASRVAALALLATLAAAAPACAAGTRLAGPAWETVGPVFAGDAVVWGNPVKRGFNLHLQRGERTRRTHVEIPELEDFPDARVDATLEASGPRVAVVLFASTCSTSSACGSKLYAALLTGRVGGELERVAGCQSRAGCAGDPCLLEGGLDVSGDSIAYDDCDGVHVRDLAPGASPA